MDFPFKVISLQRFQAISFNPMSHGLREYTENLLPYARNTPNLFPLRTKMNHLESIYHKLGAWLAWAFRQRTERPGKKNFSEKTMN